MKHNLKITLLLLLMFLTTQIIGLYVVNHYSTIKIINGKAVQVSAPNLPYGMQSPEIKQNRDFNQIFLSILLAFVVSIVLLFLLIKLKTKVVFKFWFFTVVVIALGISFGAFFPQIKYVSLISLAFAIPLAFFKIYKPNFLIHNLTELFIYPGIAAVFVPLLDVFTLSILLILISLYDMWAVWHSGVMQKMAKYQINKLKIFAGFFIPYVSKKVRLKMKKMKKSELKKKKIKANIAILGGGDVVFPVIAAGVLLKTFGIFSALLVILGACLGITYLFVFAKKKKFYPAMPFISAGIFIAIGISYLLW